MKKTTSILLVCLVAFSLQSSVEPGSFLFKKVLEAPGSLSSETGVFRIDGELYRRTADNFTDLRIFDANGKEVPFVIRHITANDTDTVHFSVDLEMENLVELPENRMALIFKRDEKDSVPSELFIATSLINFEKSVTVHGSNDKKKWHMLAEKQPVFDYSQYVDVRNTTVSFKKKKFTYYKVAVDNVWQVKWSPFSQIVTETSGGTVKKKYKSFLQQQEPFRLEKVSFSGYVQKIRYGEHQKGTYQLTVASSTEDTTKKLTEVLLSSKRESLYKLLLTIKESNFRRHTTVEGTNDTTDDPQWWQVASSEIFSIKAGEFSREKLEILLSGSYRYVKYRLKIINRDNTPITVENVSAEGDTYEVLFFHRDHRGLKVFYCSDEVKAPQYDVASVLEKAPVVKGALWKVGGQVENEAEPGKDPLIKPKHLLIGSLVLMVAVLAFVLFMAVGKVEEKTGSEDSGE
jgi:hypothetical protein